jgi:hypothetical protein
MATTTLCAIAELKTKVFTCLREDGCDADLAHCAGVHPTWTDQTLDALWLGLPGIVCEDNKARTRAIALLPRSCRQKYADLISVLDFTDFGGIFVHATFDDLAFPRLREVIPRNTEDVMRVNSKKFRLSKYLQPTLQTLKLVDRTNDTIEGEFHWLTVSFLTDVVVRCPDLKEVSLSVAIMHVEVVDLARFFQSIRPRVVTLDLSNPAQHILTGNLPAALSHGGRLERLAFASENDEPGEREKITAVELQRFLDVLGSQPFSHLKCLDLCLDQGNMPLIPQCFPAVMSLRLDIVDPQTRVYTRTNREHVSAREDRDRRTREHTWTRLNATSKSLHPSWFSRSTEVVEH